MLENIEFTKKQKISFSLIVMWGGVFLLVLALNGGLEAVMQSQEEPFLLRTMVISLGVYILGIFALGVLSFSAESRSAKRIGIGCSISLLFITGIFFQPTYSMLKNESSTKNSTMAAELDSNLKKIEPILQKANDGDLRAQYLAGSGYQWGPNLDVNGGFSKQGMGFPKDVDKAIEYYKMAVAQRSPEAAMELSLIYKNKEYNALNTLYFGKGYNVFTRKKVMAKNDKAAIKYLKLAAGWGHKDAQYMLGQTYLNGYAHFGLGGQSYKVDNIDKVEAEKWLQKAANQGNVNAISTLKEEFSR